MATLPKTMKAQVFYEKEKMKYEEIPVPQISDDEILVRVKAVGICGSDVAYYFGNSPLETPTGKGPLVLGHEFTAEVVQVGAVPAKAKLFKPGDRVVVNPVQHCNACEICAKGQTNLCECKSVIGVSVNGGFAEYCASKYTGLVKLPDDVSFEEGALTEPLACVTYGIQNMQITPGNFVVIMGPGAIGLMMLQLAKSSGAGKVALVGGPGDDYRLEAGKKLGADHLINVADKNSKHYTANLEAEISKLTGGRMADRVITPTGSVEAMEAALTVSGRRSTVVYFGLPSDKAVIRVPALKSIFWDKTIRFSWLAPFTWPTAVGAVANKLVDTKALITHRFPLAKLEEAIQSVANRQGSVLKAVITS